jgi:hypothetical protein
MKHPWWVFLGFIFSVAVVLAIVLFRQPLPPKMVLYGYEQLR